MSNKNGWPVSWEAVKDSVKKKELMYEWNPGVGENGEPVYGIEAFDQNVQGDVEWVWPNKYGNVVVETEYWAAGYPLDDLEADLESLPFSITDKPYTEYASSFIIVDAEHMMSWKTLTGYASSVDILANCTYDIENRMPTYKEKNINIHVHITNIEHAGIKSIRIYKVS